MLKLIYLKVFLRAKSLNAWIIWGLVSGDLGTLIYYSLKLHIFLGGAFILRAIWKMYFL